MLTHLHIRNYALISHLDIDFHEGFSVLTGETGAGKSIILGALNLVMGARADSRTITEGEEKCVIEATFRPPAAIRSQTATLLDRLRLLDTGNRSLVKSYVLLVIFLIRLLRLEFELHLTLGWFSKVPSNSRYSCYP